MDRRPSKVVWAAHWRGVTSAVERDWGAVATHTQGPPLGGFEATLCGVVGPIAALLA